MKTATRAQAAMTHEAARDQIDISSYTFFLRGGLPIKAACPGNKARRESFLDAYALAVQFKQGSARGEPRWRRHTYRLSRRWPEPPSAV